MKTQTREEYRVSCLITVPASDGNFISALNSATIADIKKALRRRSEFGKGKIQKLEARLKKLKRQEQDEEQ